MKKITACIAFILVNCFLALSLTACGSSIRGTWTDSSGLISYTFAGKGRGSITLSGVETPFFYEIEDDILFINGARYKYKIEGDKLTLEFIGAPIAYTKKHS